jgi:hypothetical protein
MVRFIVTAIDKAAVAEPPRLSVTLNTIDAGPAVGTAGVPEIAPVDGFNPSPEGRGPDWIDQIYGGMPPAAVSIWEYGSPTLPSGNGDTVLIVGFPKILMVRSRVADRDKLSVTWTVIVIIPVISPGVPAMIPVAGLKVRPVGNVPAIIDHTHGSEPPVESRVCEYGIPTSPFGNGESVVITGPETTLIVSGFDPVREARSVTLNTIVLIPPATVGVPVIRPVDGVSDNPGGRIPD